MCSKSTCSDSSRSHPIFDDSVIWKMTMSLMSAMISTLFQNIWHVWGTSSICGQHHIFLDILLLFLKDALLPCFLAFQEIKVLLFHSFSLWFIICPFFCLSCKLWIFFLFFGGSGRSVGKTICAGPHRNIFHKTWRQFYF